MPGEYPVIITNPPYGERIGDKEALERIYYKMDRLLAKDRGCSLYLITADKEFERSIRSRKKADRRRKLYNGRIETTYYQYYGEKPKKQETDRKE
jgi:putative N6-adenine-specific DNA methylase